MGADLQAGHAPDQPSAGDSGPTEQYRLLDLTRLPTRLKRLEQHRFYCGVDLHARTMYVCVLDQAGNIVLHKDLYMKAIHGGKSKDDKIDAEKIARLLRGGN